MKDPDSAKTGRSGLARVQLAVVEELGWLFRNQPTDDYGIDARSKSWRATRSSRSSSRCRSREARAGFASPHRVAGVTGLMRRTCSTGPTTPCRSWSWLYDEQTKAAHWKLGNRKTLERSSRGGWKVLVDHAEHHGSTRRSNHASALRLRP